PAAPGRRDDQSGNRQPPHHGIPSDAATVGSTNSTTPPGPGSSRSGQIATCSSSRASVSATTSPAGPPASRSASAGTAARRARSASPSDSRAYAAASALASRSVGSSAYDAPPTAERSRSSAS